MTKTTTSHCVRCRSNAYHMLAAILCYWLMFRRKDEAETILITKQVVLHSTSASFGRTSGQWQGATQGKNRPGRVTRTETDRTFCPLRSHPLIERHSSWGSGKALTTAGKSPEQWDGLVHIQQQLA